MSTERTAGVATDPYVLLAEAVVALRRELDDLRGTILARQTAGVYGPAAGSPEGSVAAPVGSVYLRSDGAAVTTLWVKEGGGSGDTGWVAK